MVRLVVDRVCARSLWREVPTQICGWQARRMTGGWRKTDSEKQICLFPNNRSLSSSSDCLCALRINLHPLQAARVTSTFFLHVTWQGTSVRFPPFGGTCDASALPSFVQQIALTPIVQPTSFRYPFHSTCCDTLSNSLVSTSDRRVAHGTTAVNNFRESTWPELIHGMRSLISPFALHSPNQTYSLIQPSGTLLPHGHAHSLQRLLFSALSPCVRP